MLTAGPVSKMASQQVKALCVLRFEVSRSVITVQREFHARFRKDAPATCVRSAVRFSCLLRGRGASFQDGVAAGKGVLCAPFWGVQICDYSAA